MASFKAINVILACLALLTGSSYADDLSTDYYSKKCSKVLDIVKPVVESAISKEKRNGASLLRLQFHDCFVNGCDGSILLDDTKDFKGEKGAAPNKDSIRGYDIVDEIKKKVEEKCPGIVSCADIITIAARDSVEILGGPSWDVKLGRRDSKTASFEAANSGDIPPPTSSLDNLIKRFKSKGLDEKDLVALTGAHTIGEARCVSFRDHIYDDKDIDSSFAKLRQKNCPKKKGSGDDNLAPLDIESPTKFDNKYFKDLEEKKGLLHSDQELYNGGSTDSFVKTYKDHQDTFNSDFVDAIIKMGDIEPLTGKKGEIRKNCRKRN